MAIPIFFVALIVAVLLSLVLATKVFEVVGFFALSLLGIAIVAVVYISLFVGGISVAALYQLWGEGNMGWAIAASGVICLFTGWLLLRAIVNEIRCFSMRVKGWFGSMETGLPSQSGEK